MSQRPLFPVTVFRTVVARLGIPLLLLFASPAPDQGQQRPSAAELLDQFQTSTVFWKQFEVAKAIVKQRPSAAELLDQFQTSTVFWKQFEVAKAIVAAKDTSVLPQLES